MQQVQEGASVGTGSQCVARLLGSWDPTHRLSRPNFRLWPSGMLRKGGLSFQTGEEEEEMGQLRSLKDAGLPAAFGRQKAKGKRPAPGTSKADAAAAAEAAESERLAALSAKFTPFQPKAIQLTAALGSKDAEAGKKGEGEDEEESGEPERPLTALEERMKKLKDKISKASDLNKKVRLPYVFGTV